MRGGGVALYVAEHLLYTRRLDLESGNLEFLWVEITANKTKVLCGVCYRPPNQSAEIVKEFLNSLQNSFDLIFMKQFSAIFLLGDFNAH